MNRSRGARRGIILAAGKGARLNGSAGDKPKCLATLGGITLIERQIDVLREAGIDDIAVVVGYQAAAVRRVCGPGVDFVENAQYARTNSLYSLWLARPMLAAGAGCVVMNCDVLFHPQILDDLLTARHEDALLVAFQEDGTAYGDEEMKVKVRRGRVVEIDKALPAAEADGENVGIAKFGASGARLLTGILDAEVRAGALRAWAPRAFGVFAQIRALHAVGTRGYPWTEIDFPEDYARAVRDVLPAIEDARAPALPAVGE